MIDDSNVGRLRTALKKSLGLDDNVVISIDRKFKDYNPDVDKSSILEIFQAMKISSDMLKQYICNDILTDRGRNLLVRVEKYAAEESPNACWRHPNLYNLAKSENLDNLAREATFFDLFYLIEYLDK